MGLFLCEIAFALCVVCVMIFLEVPCGFKCLQMSIDVQIDVGVKTLGFIRENTRVNSDATCLACPPLKLLLFGQCIHTSVRELANTHTVCIYIGVRVWVYF